MKISNQNIDKFLSRDFQNYNAILLYGPDLGLVSDHCDKIIRKAIDTDLATASLNKIKLQYKEVCANPSILIEELMSMSFFGNKKIVIIENVEGILPKALQEILEDNKDNIIVFKAQELPSSSNIRKFFETKKNMAALPCYIDSSIAIKQLILKFLKEHNLELEDPSVIDEISEMLKGDRKAIESEMKKIALYYNNQNKERIRVPSKELFSILSTDYLLLEYDSLLNSIIANDSAKFQQLISQMLSSGENIITILRNISSFFIKLLKAKTIIEKRNLPIDTALKAVTPPVFFKQVPIFKKALNKYSIPSILRILNQLTEIEKNCKTVSVPQEAISKNLYDCLSSI